MNRPVLLWLLAVGASLVVPEESAATRPWALAFVVVALSGWAAAEALLAGRLPLPRRWVLRAQRPLSSVALVALGAAVGPMLSLCVLGCLRVVALSGRPEDRL